MYTQSITHTRRTAFVLAVDCSSSMTEQVSFNHRPMSKAQAVAMVTNRLLFELTERARRNEGIRDYYDVAVVGYSGDGVKSLISTKEMFYSIAQIAQMSTATPSTKSEYRLPDGSATLLNEVAIPTWVTPEAHGETPMYDALLNVRDLVAAWIMQPDHTESFPPIVFNITDGEASDCDDDELRGVCKQIRSLHTNDGNVLLINIHIASSAGGQALIFPMGDEALYGNRYASLLYDCSSEMPAAFETAIRELRGGTPPFRGMSYNASVTELLSVLNIGSISLKTE
ncbi:MAG: VWA domain-containing protein [Alistipes sp.]